MMWRRWLAVIGVIVVAALLAFPLREVVNQLILVPIAYLLWLLKLIYLSLDQAVWWILAVVVVVFIIGQSLIPDFKPVQKMVRHTRRERGNVETLVIALEKSDKGTYFKWLIANRLGKLAYQILLRREHGKPRSVFAPLIGDGWDASPEVQAYLEKGLHGSFADYPNRHWFSFVSPEKTSLDHEVIDVVKFLETKVEDVNLP
ncbi:MAG: hypothetical protein ABI986_11030 [Chloroflexota bacterium]